MDTTTFGGRPTSRIGFGCGRLAGGPAAPASRRLVEAARALGITHFDVAPVYGLGQAEDVLGEVLADDPAVTIATKVGIARPGATGLKSLARSVLRPLLAATPGLRAKLGAKVGGAARGQFAPEQVEASVAESLQRLRRDRVDALLLHQAAPGDVTDALRATMQRLLDDGRAGALGSGTGTDLAELAPFGTVRQYRWSPEAAPGHGRDVVHGMLRRYPPPARDASRDAETRALGFDPADPAGWPALLLTLALATTPGGVVLVSSSSAERLVAPLRAIDWAEARSARADFVPRAVALLG